MSLEVGLTNSSVGSLCDCGHVFCNSNSPSAKSLGVIEVFALSVFGLVLRTE